jgi:esterase/lipase superfamily enzyme
MHTEYHKFYSPHLTQDFELKSYGHAGKPLVVFPSQDGRFYDFENWKMIDAIAGHIDAGKVKVFCIDGRDWESWTQNAAHPNDRARRYSDYDAAVLFDVLPFIRSHSHMHSHRDMILTGCSMGAYHAVNFFLRHPDAADTVIALSGVYRLKTFLGDYIDNETYHHSPINYLEHLADPHYLRLYRQSRIVICCGQGRWEEECLADSKHLSHLLHEKNVPHWLDLWGHDVDHDWPWWRAQLPYFLDKLGH